jgi:nitric oxide reductase NorD protein
MSVLSILEPEEAVGSRWHSLAQGRSSLPRFEDAAVALDSVAGALSIFFRGLGGERALRFTALTAETSQHRLRLPLRWMVGEERVEHARRDAQAIYLPASIAAFPRQALNRSLYFWLAAFFAHRAPSERRALENSLARDVAYLRDARHAANATVATAPGLSSTYHELCARHRSMRPARRLPQAERAIESAIDRLLGGEGDGGEFWPFVSGDRHAEELDGPRNYRPFLPAPVWGDALESGGDKSPEPDADACRNAARAASQDERARKAKRRDSDQTDRKDYLALNRFEKLLTMVQNLNINRAVEDDDEEGARKALEDSEEISLGAHSKKPSTRLKVELDIAPSKADGGGLSGLVYPEWDYKLNAYRKNYCRVLTRAAREGAGDWQPDEAVRRRIRRVRRQFEAMRPRHVTLRSQLDGSDLDLDAAIRAQTDLASTGSGSDAIYLATRRQERDLSVAILADASLSTDSYIDGRRVLDIEKEALLVLTHALEACGDEHAIFTFTSRRRHAVEVETVKEFDEALGAPVVRRISSLKPGYYTRMGAAIRHASARLDESSHRRRLLLILTDGKPNDTDHYEGRYGIEDTRRAIQEARRLGHVVFGVTIDQKAQNYFPALFGRGGYAIVNRASRLPHALPALYKQLCG